MNSKLWIIIATIFALALFRLGQWIPNVSPIAAMALFAGAQFTDRKMAFIVPLSALLLSDLLLGLHSSMLFVYAAFAIIVALGRLIRHRQDFWSVLLATLGGSLLFFLLTNFGSWLSHDNYAADISGLMQSYIAGIPFYRNTLIGDLLFSALLFGGYQLISNRWNSYSAQANAPTR